MGETTGTHRDGSSALPAEVLSELEAAWFRNTGARPRMLAVSEIEAKHPKWREKIREFVAGFPSTSTEDEPVPERIGPYRILSLLGRGGFGEVYRATQVEGLQREVALKVLKLGMDTRAILRRFSRERDALARMNHDAIAKIFDAGTTEIGKPWFSMELVEGLAITKFCRERGMPLRARLELFCAVCEGVHHAHQKGLVHRDLKPSNILVSGSADAPRPKLIDFGIARAIEREDDSMDLTETGSLLGTPRYMAPEQLRGEFQLVDTRADVFSLGAILYELCTGVQPFAEALAGAGLAHEVRQRIRDLEIGRPSACAHDPDRPEAQWSRSLRGDLDWIVGKATDRDIERRYGSVADLAADVRRHLDDVEVVAGPPSTAYAVRKYVRRHRLQVAAIAGVMATAIVGAAVSLRYAMIASERAEEATQERRDVLRLAARQDLDVLVRGQEALWPPHPDRIADCEAWIARAERLVAELPAHRRQRDLLQARARERSEQERAADRASHPNSARLAAVGRELAARELAFAVRSARRRGASFDESSLGSPTETESQAQLPASPRVRFDLARSWSWPERTEFGRERVARAILRELLVSAQLLTVSELHEAIAWAEFACGDDDAALDAIASAEATAGEGERFASIDGSRLREAVARSRSDEGMAQADRVLESLRSERDRLDAEVDVRRTWSFAADDTATAWWCAQLDALIADLERLRLVHLDPEAVADPVVGWGVSRRLRVARSLSRAFEPGGDCANAWQAAAEGLARVYPGSAIRPQAGLIPIGPDPKSGLWEFAHLCSGLAPTRDAMGQLALGPESAIVFVLVPGGAFRMGASRTNGAEGFDPLASLTEEPAHEVRLSPYFLAKHEVTQPQWQRVMGTQPSAYTPRLHWITSPLHPVEQVSWFDADRFCRRVGLSLPTEAQWEHAARGGTTARWSIADHREQLVGRINIADRTAASRGATWPSISDWPDYEDGWPTTCPIGSLPSNAFGFHEMLGNLWEWCLDGYYAHAYETHAAIDPVHPSASLPQRSSRGGSFDNTIASVRVTSRDGAAPQVSGHTIGFRPARRVE